MSDENTERNPPDPQPSSVPEHCAAAADERAQSLPSRGEPTEPPEHADEAGSVPIEAVPADVAASAPEALAQPDAPATAASDNAEAVPDRSEPRTRRPISSAGPSIHFTDVVSGQFDADEQTEDGDTAPLLRKRVLAPQAETPKLHKVLAQAGMGSRLDMEQLIVEGRISVNNEPAHIGQRIQHGDSVKVNGKPVRYRLEPPPARVLAYHKPAGEVVTTDDPQNRPTVFRKLPRLTQGKWQSVGRLDLNTEGLLLFTSSGEFANQLMHPRFGLEREYAVRVLGSLSGEEKARLLSGVELGDGSARFGSIEDGGGEGANCWYRVTISEGRNREVRRMFECVGHAVSRLIRIRYGAMLLPRGLKRGGWLELDERDIRQLSQAAGAALDRREAKGDARSARPPRHTTEQPASIDRRGARSGGRRNGGIGGAGEQGPATHQSAFERAPDVGRPSRGPGGRGRGGPPGGGSREQPPSRQERGDARGGNEQPDPMKTAFGYIGADSFLRQREGSGPRRGSPGGPAGGGNRFGRGGGVGGNRAGGGSSSGPRRGGGGGRGR